MVTSPMNANTPHALKYGIRRRLNCISSIMVEKDALGQLNPVPATLSHQFLLSRIWKRIESERGVRKSHDERSQIQCYYRNHHPVIPSR